MKNELMKMENKEACACEKTLEVMPLVDILEDEDKVTLYFEVPGANSSSVCIEVKERVLSVCAKSCLCREGRRIVFRREFVLSELINVEKITAKTQDGVLTLVLPKCEQAKVHRIQVS